jgi:multicomponent Na+:H+ antiporter subunit A
MSSLILETGARAVFHTIWLFSVFLLFAGHNAPGGGFVGGLVAAAALVLVFIAEGRDAVRRMVRVPPERILGTGILLAVGTAVAPLLRGGALLTSSKLELTVPLLGTVKSTSALVFDIGVYAIVIGLLLTALDMLGEELDA